jgi:hypothetical protein
MRKSTFTVALVLLAVLVWFGLQGGQPRAADAAKPAAQKFEYKQDEWSHLDGGSTLNVLGDEGWEMCGVIPKRVSSPRPDDAVVIFKRPKQ